MICLKRQEAGQAETHAVPLASSKNNLPHKNSEASVIITIVQGSMLKGQAWRDLKIRGAVC
jgi:hypothetical protein